MSDIREPPQFFSTLLVAASTNSTVTKKLVRGFVRFRPLNIRLEIFELLRDALFPIVALRVEDTTKKTKARFFIFGKILQPEKHKIDKFQEHLFNLFFMS